MATKRRRVGSTASEYVPQENEGEVWIFRFRDPSTQIRICPTVRVRDDGKTVYGTEAWWSAREHYDDGVGSWACTCEDLAEKDPKNDCVGCNDPSERVSKRNRQYYVNALDSRGNLRVYKMGVNLFKAFEGREQRMLAQDPSNKQPLSDRDYIINKMGQKLNTSYDLESGDKYTVEFPSELFDVEQILLDKVEQVEAAYGNGEPIPAAKAKDEEPQEERTSTRIPTKKAAAAGGRPTAAASNGDEPEVEQLPQDPSEEQIDDAETPAIKAYLDRKEVEYPSRAPRARLVKMAKETANKVPY